MGIGDDIIATGMARGAAERGEKIAFGDGRQIKWGPYSEMIFRDNSNIARPGQERQGKIRWIEYYKGHRLYNAAGLGRWVWNYGFHVTPGELFLDGHEMQDRDDDLILLEPNVPNKRCAPNKQWPVDRWAAVSGELTRRGWRVRQFEYGGPNHIAVGIPTAAFREAAGWLRAARLVILPEGGLHHAAAAAGAAAIVLFGGFTPPGVLGYDSHVNLTGGAEACGSFGPCAHCAEAMAKITVEEVLSNADEVLRHGEYKTNLLQDFGEFSDFLRLIQKNQVRSYLEIGSKHGGSLWRIGTALPRGSRVVSVDLPYGDRSFKESEPHLRACVAELRNLGYDTHLFLTDSTDPDTVEKVRALGPFDLCLIDANHTEPYVRKDWASYGQMAEMVAFHDIAWQARLEPSKKMPIDVPRVWEEIKQSYRHVEFKRCPRDNGIGVLWKA